MLLSKHGRSWFGHFSLIHGLISLSAYCNDDATARFRYLSKSESTVKSYCELVYDVELQQMITNQRLFHLSICPCCYFAGLGSRSPSFALSLFEPLHHACGWANLCFWRRLRENFAAFCQSMSIDFYFWNFERFLQNHNLHLKVFNLPFCAFLLLSLLLSSLSGFDCLV